KREHLLPAVQRLLNPVHRPVVIEEAVPGTVVAMKLVLFAVLFEFRLVLVNLLRGRRAVFIAEQAEQRAGKVSGKLDRRGRLLRRQLLLAHHHATAPQVGSGVYAFGMAGKQEGLPPTGAGADDADLTVEPGLSAQPLHSTFGVADDLRIGNAALGAHLGGDVVGFALAGAVVKIMAGRRIAVMRE